MPQPLQFGTMTFVPLLFLLTIGPSSSSHVYNSFSFVQDVSSDVFGDDSESEDLFPVAFGDYDSDKKTDLLVVTKDFSSFDILFGSGSSSSAGAGGPWFEARGSSFLCTLEPKYQILSVNLADFDGDGINDILVAYELKIKPYLPIVWVRILRGTLTKSYNCDDPDSWIVDEPLVLSSVPLIWDYGQNLIADLVGEVEPGVRKIWEFHSSYGHHSNRPIPTVLNFPNCVPKDSDSNHTKCIPLTDPLVGGYVDIDGDFNPELVLLSTQTVRVAKNNTYIEIYSISRQDYDDGITIQLQKNLTIDADFYMNRIGNPLFLDLDLTSGPHQILLPYCQDKKCHEPKFLVVDPETGKSTQLDVKFEDSHGQKWTFLHPNFMPDNLPFTNTINVHAGDYNLDGYPDLVATLTTNHKSISESSSRSVLFLNVPCSSPSCGTLKRTFKPEFHYLENTQSPVSGLVLSTAFFDYQDNGLLDLIGLRQNPKPERISIKSKPNITYSLFAYKNTPEYDAYFIKGLVTSGRRCGQTEDCVPYGVWSLGASMKYSKINLNNQLQCGRASQVLRSNFALDLPTMVLGTGASANFIDSVTFGISSRITSTKTQVIPNSFLIAIPPDQNHSKWEVKYILNLNGTGFWGTLLTLGFISSVNLSIVFLFQWRERKEDLMERSKDPITMGALRLT